MNLENMNFELPHMILAGFTNGQVGKPPLLAIHGWLDNAGSFELMMPYWNDYHVVAIDLPGHGLSARRSADGHYHFVDWAYDLSQLLDFLKWSDVTIVGHSMGAMIGNVLAAVLPERIHRLVLLDSIGLITTPAENACDQLRHAINSRKLIANKPKHFYSDRKEAIDARVRAGGVTKKEAEVLAVRGLRQTSRGLIWRSDPRLRAASAVRFSVEQAISFIRQIQCPVFMLEGKDSSDLVPKMREQFQPYYAYFSWYQMEGGHHCHMMYPQIAARHIRAFLQQGQ